MNKIARGVAGLFSRAVQTIIVGALAVSLIAVPFAIADYTATQGTGTTFASIVISLKHYFTIIVCDATIGETQCQAVNSSGSAQVDWTTSSQAHTDLGAPPNQAYSATWGGCTYSSGNNPACGDAKGAWWQDIGAINGVALLAGAGATGTGSQRVTAAQDTTTIAGSAPGTAGTPSANVVSVQGESSMTPVLVTPSAPADPCFASAKTNLAINQNGTSLVQLIALSGSTKIYVCSLFLMTNSTATTFALTAGTGTACATPTGTVIGPTTANIANGPNLITGAGLTLGNGGGTIASGVASSELCMVLGSNVYVSGNLTFVQQ